MSDAADWVKLGLQGGATLLSGIVGAVIGIWQAGKRSGKQEAELEEKIKHDVKQEMENRLQQAIGEMKAMIIEAADNHELLVSQFQEAFNGLRRQMDETKLETEENFVRKDDFRQFRAEYREDQQRVHEKLDKILMGRQ